MGSNQREERDQVLEEEKEEEDWAEEEKEQLRPESPTASLYHLPVIPDIEPPKRRGKKNDDHHNLLISFYEMYLEGMDEK